MSNQTRGHIAYGRSAPTSASRRRLLPALAAISMAATSATSCGGSGQSPTQFGNYASTRIQGQIVRPAGTPLDSVAVAVYATPRDGASYDLPNSMTGSTGAIDFTLNRTMARPGFSLPVPDTATVVIMATDLRAAASPPAVRDSVLVLVRFAPTGEPAPVTTVTIPLRAQ